MEKTQPHLNLITGDVPAFVFLPGDPARIDKITKYWDSWKEIAYQREFRTCVGTYKGIPVAATSTGIGSPSAAIAVEELVAVGAKTFIRIGTCGALKSEIQPGDIIIPSRALRLEGTTQEYVNDDFQASADPTVLKSLETSAKELGIKSFTGVNRTHDAFYESAERFLRLMKLPEYACGELISSEMECSAIYTVAKLRNTRAGAVLAVNTTEPLDRIAKNPDLIYQLEVSPRAAEGIDRAIRTALRAVELLDQEN
ncbi:uridine phosphorylase [Candidatus Parcubacteria bacterium]|jgi:uridine phosphorylase|nr:MAG: uridine phosphorylase [Candidatus Parcubacteria bacterium]